MANLKGKNPGALFDAALTAGPKPSSLQPLLDKLPDEDNLSGKTVGNYTLGDKIGVGAFGRVYRAKHTHLGGKEKAVKILKEKIRNDEKGNENYRRFLQEAKLLAGINHDNIVSATDFGTTDDGRTYLVMEYLGERNLSTVLSEEKNISLERAINIVSQICSGLGAAHKIGVVHRDIKPSNIMLVDKDFVKIIDFGIAKLIGEHKPTGDLTQTGTVFGTPKYISPEQVKGKPPVDQRSDAYSVGAIFYEMLCGKPPFDDDLTIKILLMHVNEKVTPPSKTRPDLPPEVDRIILKAMAKNMDDRYSSMEEFAAAIANIGKKSSGMRLSPTSPRITANLKKPEIKSPDAPATSSIKQTAVTHPTADPEGNTIAAPSIISTNPQELLRQIHAETAGAKEDAKKTTPGSDLNVSEVDDSAGRLVELKIRKADKTIYKRTTKSRETVTKPESKYKDEVEAGVLGTFIAGTITAMHPGIFPTIKGYLTKLPALGQYFSSMEVQPEVAILGNAISSSFLVAGAATMTVVLTAILIIQGLEAKKKGENK